MVLFPFQHENQENVLISHFDTTKQLQSFYSGQGGRSTQWLSVKYQSGILPESWSFGEGEPERVDSGYCKLLHDRYEIFVKKPFGAFGKDIKSISLANYP